MEERSEWCPGSRKNWSGKATRSLCLRAAESETTAKLVVCAPQSLRLAGIRDHLGSTLAMLREVRRRADDFDIIHFHLDLLPKPCSTTSRHKCLATLHGRLDLPDILPLYKAYPEMPLVSISNAQRRPMPANANWLATIPTASLRMSARSIRKAEVIWLFSAASRLKNGRIER